MVVMGMVVMQIVPLPLLIRIFKDLINPPFPSIERKTHLQMEAFLINVKVCYRRATSTWFSEPFLCLLFLKSNQPKLIFMLKRHILGWQILPFSTLRFLSKFCYFGATNWKWSSHSLTVKSLKWMALNAPSWLSWWSLQCLILRVVASSPKLGVEIT